MHRLDARIVVSVVAAVVAPSPYILISTMYTLNLTNKFFYSLTFTMLGYHRQRRLSCC